MNITSSAAAVPERKLSIVDDFGELTADELRSRVGKLASSLATLGIGPGTSVAIMCRNHRIFIEAFRAAVMVGADVQVLSTEYTAVELEAATRVAETEILIHDDEFSSRLQSVDVRRKIIAFSPSGTPGSLEELARGGGKPPVPAPVGRMLLFTSGTEGQPRLSVRHGPISDDTPAALLSRVPFQQGDTILCLSPLFHSWGLVLFKLALILNARLVLPLHLDPDTALDQIASHRPAVLATAPVLLRGIIDRVWDGRHDLSGKARQALRLIAVAGSALPPGLASDTTEIFGGKLYSIYGSTEAGLISVAAPSDLQAAPTTAGRPLDSVSVRIVNADQVPVSAGERGQIVVSGDMTDGRAENPRQASVVTGDTGYIDAEGRLFVTGRSDDMAVIGGKNVYPAEIEDLLLSHPAILDATVVAIDDDKYTSVLVAFIVGCPGIPLDAKDLRGWLSARIARFKIPKRFYFRAELKRTPSGKIQKRALAASIAPTGPPREPGN